MDASKLLAAVAGIIGAAALPACDAINVQELRPGVSTATEVHARMGPATGEFRNGDGGVTLEFSRQPAGSDCYMAVIGPDQILKSLEQVLTEDNLARVRPGMSAAELRRLLGRPARVDRHENLGEEVWDWRVAGLTPGEQAHFHAHFDLASGLVKRTSRRVEVPG